MSFKDINETGDSVPMDELDTRSINERRDAEFRERNRRDDELISSAMEKVKSEAREREDWEKSSKERRELERRYGDVGGFLDTARNLNEHMVQDPVVAAERLASGYIHNSAMFDEDPRKQDDGTRADKPEEEVPSHVKFDRIFEDAWDNHERRQRDDKDFAQWKDHRAFVRQNFPGESYKDAFNRFIRADDALRADPVGTAQRIAARHLPVTALDQEVAALQAERQQAAGSVEQQVIGMINAGHVPNLGVLHKEVEAIIADPMFHRTGDHMRDLKIAHDIATHAAVRKSRQPAATAAKPKPKAQSNFDQVLDAALTRMGYTDDD